MTLSKRNDNSNSSQRLLISVVIDVSPSTNYRANPSDPTANELINKHLKLFINQLMSYPKIRCCAEICFVTYSTDIHVSDFVPLKTLQENTPTFEAVSRGGTRTIAAVEAAYKAIHNRAQDIVKLAVSGGGLHNSAMFLLTDGDDVHTTLEDRERVTQMVNRCTISRDRSEKVLPIICATGSHFSDKTKDMLTSLNKGFFDGFFYLPDDSEHTDMDYKKLFTFFSESLVIVTSKPHVYSSNPGSEEYIDELLDDLHALIDDEYSDMVYPNNT